MHIRILGIEKACFFFFVGERMNGIEREEKEEEKKE